MFSIQTERLLLRPIEPDDWRFLLEINTTPGVREHLLPEQDTEAAVRRWVEQSVTHDRACSGYHFGYMILLEGQAEPIGYCGLSILEKARRNGQIWWGLHPTYWGVGYATEAARTLVQLGFGPCQLNRIRAECYRDNAASRRVMEKTGLRQKHSVGARLALYWNYSVTGSKVRYEISRKEWICADMSAYD